MSKDNDTLYAKHTTPSGKTKYIPIGIYGRDSKNILFDGIWYIHHNDHSVGTANVDRYLSTIYRIGDPSYVDIPSVCGKHECTEYILDSPEFKSFRDKGYTWFELVGTIVNLVCEFKKKQDDKKAVNRDSK